MRMASWFSSGRSAGSSSSDPDAFRRKLDRMGAKLKDVRAWLDDVESQVTVDAQTELRKEEFKGWAYGVEDLLDDLKYEQLRADAEAATAGRKSKRDPVADLMGDSSFMRRVDDLMQNLAEIGQFGHSLRLGKRLGQRNRSVEPPPSSSLLVEQHIYDRKDDREMLVNFLLSKDVMEETLTVIPVVGAAGVGKTAFVQYSFNDGRVSERFHLRGWVSATRHLDIMGLVRAIGETLTGKACTNSQLGLLQNLVKRTTDEQRFLLVLDGVRAEVLNTWEMVRAIFSGCACGSVIILTTQDARVADRTAAGASSYFLESISDENCWSIFQKYAFHFPPTDDRCAEIRRKIVEDCQGSPLVAKALGTRLRYERDVDKWPEILGSDMWDEVPQELRPCYSDLPAYLKPCFLYCSMFPKGHPFREEELVRLWMAQGFIPEEKVKSLEDEGSKYFAKLLSESFFQRSPAAYESFVMPNRLHALAQSISDGECLTIGGSNSGGPRGNDLEKARHLCLMPTSIQVIEQSFSIIKSLAHFRTFLLVQTLQTGGDGHISLPDDAFYSLNCLRVLDVSNTNIRVLPSTIGDLKHLRYLNLRGTKIRDLPASVSKLYTLQTLDLSHTEISKLPNAFGNLTNLRYLDLNVTKVWRLPESIGKLSKLHRLLLGATELEELPETIGGLKGLKFLRLNVSKIQRPASIHDLSSLQSLELRGAEVDMLFEHLSDEQSQDAVGDSEGQLDEFSNQIIVDQNVIDMPDSNGFRPRRINHSSSHDAVREEDVLEKLQPHTNLRELDIRFYSGTRFPKWMECPLSKLTHVVLKNCMKCVAILQFGQLPHLKELDIDGMSVGPGQDFCGGDQQKGFPSLQKLSFKNMYGWEKWDGVKEDDFPCLEELIFFNCPKLKEISHLSSSLVNLKVERCDYLRKFSERLDSLCSLTLMYCQNLESLPVMPVLEELWMEECEKLLPHVSLPTSLEMCQMSSTAFVYRKHGDS